MILRELFLFLQFDQFINTEFSVMNADSVASSHPVSVDVNTPDEINELFDAITYNKGASLIRMMNYFLGDKVFLNGLNVNRDLFEQKLKIFKKWSFFSKEYLEKYKYENAKQEDLWTSLDEVLWNNIISISIPQIYDETFSLSLHSHIVECIT